MSPLESKPQAGASSLLLSFTAGRALRPEGVPVAFPCLHGYEMWHTDQVPSLPYPREEGQKQAASWPLSFFNHLQTSQEEAHNAGRSTREVIIHSLFAIESAWNQSLAASGSEQSTYKIEKGTETGCSLKGSQETDCKSGSHQRPSKSCKICSSLLAGWPEKPRVKTQTWKLSPCP